MARPHGGCSARRAGGFSARTTFADWVDDGTETARQPTTGRRSCGVVRVLCCRPKGGLSGRRLSQVLAYYCDDQAMVGYLWQTGHHDDADGAHRPDPDREGAPVRG